MKLTEQPNMTLMGIGTAGVMIPLYATLFEVINPVEAMTIVIPSIFLFIASFIVKK
jgi:hypothetical protein